MTEVCAFVKFAGEFLVTLNHAKMTTSRVNTIAFNRTANIFAVMYLTFFHLITNTLALQSVNFLHFFLGHEFFSKMIRVINFIARELSFCLVADTSLVNHLFALHAFAVMTCLDALMFTTR